MPYFTGLFVEIKISKNILKNTYPVGLVCEVTTVYKLE
jgi:hypothetical protein